VVGTTEAVQLPVLLGDRGMTAVDTLFTVANPRGRLAGLAFAPIAMPPFHDVASNGSRMLVVDWSDEAPEELRIRVVTPSGDDAAVHTLRFPPRPVSRQVRDSILDAGVTAIAALAERLRAQGIPEGSFRASITRDEVAREVYLPTHYPPVRRILAGGDGSIWLVRTEGTERGPWLVLGDDGAPAFQLHLPDGVTPRFATADAVWGTSRDDFDIPYVIRWNVQR